MSDVTDQPAGSLTDKDEEAASALIESASRQAASEASAASAESGIDLDTVVTKALEKLTPNINTLLDQRVSGFQKLLADRDQQLQDQQKKLREFEIAGMSEDERSRLQQQERDEEVERLRLENELYRLGESRPKAAEAYRRLITPGLTAQQQVEILDELLQSAQPQTPAPSGQPAASVPVDRNNPSHVLPSDSVVLPGGDIMNDEVADRILRTERWTPA